MSLYVVQTLSQSKIIRLPFLSTPKFRFHATILYSAKSLNQKRLYHCFLFSFFRYVAICHPLKVSECLSKMARAGIVIFGIWISSVLFSLPWIYYNKVWGKADLIQYCNCYHSNQTIRMLYIVHTNSLCTIAKKNFQ